MVNEKLLNDLLNKMVDNKRIFSAVLCVENGDRSFSWTGAVGNMQKDSRFFIASVTKLYVTAVVMQLIEENRIELNDKISKYLPDYFCEGLHVLKGVDYSNEITIVHLICNASGLPDYFFHKQANGRTVSDELMDGNDEAWHLDKTIGLIKNLRPDFKPGAKGKAAYSDSNYQLLGRIIENVTGKNIGEVFHDYIFSKLNLSNTYAYSDIDDNSPVPFYYKSQQLWLPQYIASVTVEGGIVSTVDEVMIFLKEFFNGRFFPKERINDLKQWNLILPPPGLFYFGIGLEKLWTPRIVSPFKPIKEIVGFWGQTGSFAFYNAQTDLYFCGTTNQINGKGHRLAGNAMMKIIKSVL
ncbi:serine hydrolase domain-containing protein [Maledivibacter halophilus]|uniref:CubicO group peptidase, beta-lactamase class C family n=1 Tax=Maledivibacter halophilus TaxID=36842 RepID=A0A1T5KZD4_9FIRM|nr:serine hydrolase domain-containing protein [Maledivibacter halophilus]SKC69137.1 CubicO group peptidase, beta-lactamase class C family [Maledivibacter halophilus]